MKEWTTPDFRNTPSITNLEEEEIVDAPGKDDNASMPEEVKRPNPWIYLNINQIDALNFIMSLFHASTCFENMCSSSGGQNCTIQSLVSSH